MKTVRIEYDYRPDEAAETIGELLEEFGLELCMEETPDDQTYIEYYIRKIE